MVQKGQAWAFQLNATTWQQVRLTTLMNKEVPKEVAEAGGGEVCDKL